jgi:hypothetical protein
MKFPQPEEATMAVDLSLLREQIREDAVAKHGEFPQYGEDYWNGWQLAELTEQVQYKSGKLMRGARVIFRPHSAEALTDLELPIGGATVDAYSPDKGHHVAVPTDFLRVLTGPGS